MQKVSEGITQSGIRGLFTFGILVVKIPKHWDSLTYKQKQYHCFKRGFELV